MVFQGFLGGGFGVFLVVLGVFMVYGLGFVPTHPLVEGPRDPGPKFLGECREGRGGEGGGRAVGARPILASSIVPSSKKSAKC